MRTRPTTPAPRRNPTWTAAILLGGSLALAGCTVGGGDAGSTGSGSSGGSSPGSSSRCDLSGCTVTLQKGVDAKASVLGIDVELVGVTGDAATVRVGGQQVSVPLEGQASTTVAGLDVVVQSANDTAIVLRITRA